MATFAPFAPPTGVRRDGPDVTAALPGGPSLVWLPLVSQGAPTFVLAAPVTGTCRTVPVTVAIPGLPGVTTAVELSPLPFPAAAVLRRLPAFPTFWFAIGTVATLPTDGQLVRAGETLADIGAAWVGVHFADRVVLSSRAWIDQIATAADGVDSTAEVGAWRELSRFDPTERTLRVLDHVGRPVAGGELRVTGTAGTSILTTAADGAVALPAGELQLRWTAAQPVHALYERSRAEPGERSTSTRPGEALVLPASFGFGHLQLLDASQWFATRPAGLDPGLGHLHPDSRLEPLVDGIETFRRMLEDLRAATGTGNGAHFAGWSFNDFPLDPHDAERSMFVELVRGLRDGDGARFLMDKYLVFRPDAPTDELGRLVVLLVLLGVETLHVVSVVKDLDTDSAGFLVSVGAVLLAFTLTTVIGLDVLVPKLEAAFDGSGELADVLNALKPNIALRARHPARFTDLALDVVNPLPVDPSQFLDGTGSYHQKFQVVRREPDALGNRVVGYVGGIDMNRNRLDTPGHNGRAWRPPDQVSAAPSPQVFHDVHARITGPAAADVALTFDRRWTFDVSRQPLPAPGAPAMLDVAFGPPAVSDPSEVPPQPARHLVQIGRSGYAPDPGGGSTPLPWSPQGEATIPEAIVNAIDAAREYIYIEDQYFTPPDLYVHALLEASVREPHLRLVIVIPTSSDQLYGDIRRREVFERLRADPATGRGWGDRMIVGALVRRPVLGDAGRVASKGRLRLLETIGPIGGDAELTLGPRSRLPDGLPFWLWVEGEQMLAVERRDDVVIEWRDDDGPPPDGAAPPELIPARRYLVRRSDGTDLWAARPRDHHRGAPVTLAQTTGIYVHTKAIMVDDVFVGIGSCNTNRRGFYHDGEITAFAVAEQLKGSGENPARALRTALWAEHLGLPPAMGDALLADPIAAFELFRRSPVLGNRVSPFDALGVKPELGFPSESSTVVKMLATFGITVAEDLVPYVWNLFADPSTRTDPDPRVGPGLGMV